jgi:hypothetical protein
MKTVGMKQVDTLEEILTLDTTVTGKSEQPVSWQVVS